jgi:regulator of sigma E protease
MLATILFILILSFLVLIHELGHFFAAKWAKIKIDEFGLGYPPKALTLFTYKGTPFTINWIPFGGFVRMLGEDALPDELAEGENKVTDKPASKSSNKSKKKKLTVTPQPDEGPFYTKSAIQRLVVILAGVVVNFVFGIIAFAIVYSFLGIPTFINQARIEQVAPNSPAALANVPSDVNIIAVRVEGENQQQETLQVSTNEQVKDIIDAQRGKTVTLVTTGKCQQFACQESMQEFPLYIRTEAETPPGEGAIGVAFAQQVFVHYPWYEQVVRGVLVGVEQAVVFGGFILIALGNLVRELFQFGNLPADVAGPVGIVHQAQTQGLFNQGALMVLNFTGLLSVNLAIMNLLPIPALDGGRAMFIILEKIVGRKRVQQVEGYANYGGFIVLIILIVAITARDIWRIFF